MPILLLLPMTKAVSASVADDAPEKKYKNGIGGGGEGQGGRLCVIQHFCADKVLLQYCYNSYCL